MAQWLSLPKSEVEFLTEVERARTSVRTVAVRTVASKSEYIHLPKSSTSERLEASDQIGGRKSGRLKITSGASDQFGGF